MSRSFARLFPGARHARRSGSGLGRLPNPADAARRLEHAEALDGTVRVLADAVQRQTGSGAQADALHGVWLGQPVHPALTGLPVGFWTSAAVLDFVPGSRRASQVLIALGLAGSVPAAAAGLADWSSLHREQQRVGVVHAAANAGATALFASSLLARAIGRHTEGRALALGGLAALTASTYLGRHLAFPLGAGASHAESVSHLAPLGWHDLCRIYDLPDGRLARRQLGYLSLVVVRQGSDVLALADRCAPGRAAAPGNAHQRRGRSVRHLSLARQHVPARRRGRRARARDGTPARVRHTGRRGRRGPGQAGPSRLLTSEI